MRTIDVTYEVVTPESVEDGDTAESGFLEPLVIEPADLDEDAGETYVDVAVRLIGRGSFEADSYGRGVVPRWLTESDGSTDYRTGAETRRSYHFSEGWTDAERCDVARALGVQFD